MSEREAATIRAMFRDLSKRDVEAALGPIGEEIIWDVSNSRAPYAGVARGRDAVRERWIANFIEPWESFDVDAFEIRELGDGRLAVSTRAVARGRDGIEVTSGGGQLWTFREGKAVHVKMFQSFDEALAEAADQ